jgi:alkylated DNA nucleotide flippase Atl1
MIMKVNRNTVATGVLIEISLVPKGEVTTYGLIGQKVGCNPRQVGRILHNNPDPRRYPCHRVVYSTGKLTEAYAFGGIEEQRRKLLREGVEFKTEFKVDMKKCLYNP